MDATSLLAFWVVALLLIIVPGADWTFTLVAGLRRAVIPAVGGLAIGYLLLTAIVATGVGVLVAASPVALSVLTAVGGAYLIWHGVATLRRPTAGADPSDTLHAAEMARTAWSTLAHGIGVSSLNPKGLLIFVALLPQFTSPRMTWPVAGQIGVLGLIFVATCAAFYLALGVVARSLAMRSGLARLISRLSGVGMTVVGALLIIEHFLA